MGGLDQNRLPAYAFALILAMFEGQRALTRRFNAQSWEPILSKWSVFFWYLVSFSVIEPSQKMSGRDKSGDVFYHVKIPRGEAPPYD